MPEELFFLSSLVACLNVAINLFGGAWIVAVEVATDGRLQALRCENHFQETKNVDQHDSENEEKFSFLVFTEVTINVLQCTF